jgi:hypothetical protein
MRERLAHIGTGKPEYALGFGREEPDVKILAGHREWSVQDVDRLVIELSQLLISVLIFLGA